jgi:hypothetical protein
MIISAEQQQAIVSRFKADEAFRRSVLQDANQAVKQEFGIVLPFPVRVVPDGERYRIEPVAGSIDDLSDDQLELAAGGKLGMPIINDGAQYIRPRPGSL